MRKKYIILSIVGLLALLSLFFILLIKTHSNDDTTKDPIKRDEPARQPTEPSLVLNYAYSVSYGIHYNISIYDDKSYAVLGAGRSGTYSDAEYTRIISVMNASDFFERTDIEERSRHCDMPQAAGSETVYYFDGTRSLTRHAIMCGSYISDDIRALVTDK